MGAPSSSILSKIHLQFFQNTHIYDILLQHQIIGYFRYIDDILIVYNSNTDIHKVLNQFNSISPTLTFTIETGQNKCINFLDITICKDQKISFKIYRKPIATDIIIPKDSNHPPEHKQAVVRFLSTEWRLITYPLDNTDKEAEYNAIKQILINNKYNMKVLDKTIQTITTNPTTQRNPPPPPPPQQHNPKQNGPRSPMQGVKPNSSQNSLNIPTSKLHSKQTTP